MIILVVLSTIIGVAVLLFGLIGVFAGDYGLGLAIVAVGALLILPAVLYGQKRGKAPRTTVSAEDMAKAREIINAPDKAAAAKVMEEKLEQLQREAAEMAAAKEAQAKAEAERSAREAQARAETVRREREAEAARAAKEAMEEKAQKEAEAARQRAFDAEVEKGRKIRAEQQQKIDAQREKERILNENVKRAQANATEWRAKGVCPTCGHEHIVPYRETWNWTAAVLGFIFVPIIGVFLGFIGKSGYMMCARCGYKWKP